MNIREPYRERQICMLELWSVTGWRVKVYGIAYATDRPAARLVDEAKRLAAAVLPRPAVSAERYGVGFIGVHQGRNADLVFVDWWANENELHHHVWVTSGGDAPVFEYASPDRLVACVWDLFVIGFERQAWIDAVLAPPRADVDVYLRTTFAGRV